MDNFMDKLVEKINAQGAARNQGPSGINDIPRGFRQEKNGVTEEKLREESAKLIEAVASQMNDANAKQVELITEYKQQTEETLSAKTESAKESLADHMHKESVKCYRNTQAVIEEKATELSTGVKNSVGSLKGLLIAILILLIVNLGAVGTMLAHMFKLF